MPVRATLLICGSFIFAGLALGQPSAPAVPPLTVDEVIALLEAKLTEPVILTRIRNHGKPFTLSTDELVRLKKAGATEQVMVLMMDPSAGAPQPIVRAGAGTQPTVAPAAAGPFPEVGVYYRKGGQWMELLPEVVNWKTGGVLKFVATAGVVKKDVNGHLPGPHSRNSVTSPLEFMIYVPEGVAITEYQLIRLRAHPGRDYREFRTITGGVLNTKSGAMRDMVPFEGKRVGNRLFEVVLPATLGAGEYGFIYLGATGGAGGLTSLSMGKMYTFRLLE